MTEKTCTRCYETRPLDQFYRGNICRVCRNEKYLLWEAEKRDRARREAEADLARILNRPAPGRVLR